MAGAVTIDPVAIGRLASGPAVVEHVGRKAREVALVAANRCPHRSGRLALSIGVERLSGPLVGFSIGSRLPYARIIENATPYLEPALRQVMA